MNKYLIRLDDACPTMDKAKWQRMEDILDAAGVHPMVGIIPHNEDPLQMIDPEDSVFWEKARKWQDKDWAIALHGYNHCYTSNEGMNGLNPLWSRSEFAGLPLEEQKDKIKEGYAILKNNGLDVKYFFAPSHTFDENTFAALREESEIRIISDTIATKPYKYKDFAVIPQLGGHCTKMIIPGIWTFCLHPTTMTEQQFVSTESFLKVNKDKFISFYDLDLTNLKNKDLNSRLLSWIYFTRRKRRR